MLQKKRQNFDGENVGRCGRFFTKDFFPQKWPVKKEVVAGGNGERTIRGRFRRRAGKLAREFAEKFYWSQKWQKCRDAYIAKRVAIDGGLCEVCGERQGYIVHHKVWLNEQNINDPEIALNFSNLRFECQDCHNLERPDGTRAVRTPRCEFDPEGNPIPPRSGGR